VAPSLDAYTLLLCLALAVAPYLAANLLPAWRSAVIEPDRILRS
jgi:ABC-type lipoprotein release transport system permease subunit